MGPVARIRVAVAVEVEVRVSIEVSVTFWRLKSSGLNKRPLLSAATRAEAVTIREESDKAEAKEVNVKCIFAQDLCSGSKKE